jgi:hypothetical protein
MWRHGMWGDSPYWTRQRMKKRGVGGYPRCRIYRQPVLCSIPTRRRGHWVHIVVQMYFKKQGTDPATALGRTWTVYRFHLWKQSRCCPRRRITPAPHTKKLRRSKRMGPPHPGPARGSLSILYISCTDVHNTVWAPYWRDVPDAVL